MLYHILVALKQKLGDAFPKKLMLHCDNCAGQNKNRFVVWFFAWIVSIGMFDEAELNFLIAGHTKNECNGAFGCIKRALRKTNVKSPKQMRDLINSSSVRATAIKPGDVQWILWKNKQFQD